MSDTPNPPTTRAAPAEEKVDETIDRSVEVTGKRPAFGTDAASSPGGQPTTAQARVGSSATDVLPRIGEYVVIRKIGEGGMGAVYLAEDPRLHRKAAIKTMKPELAADPANRERFEREARAAAAIEHDNIVPIWRVGEADDGTPFIAMPFLQGEMLDARLKREPVANLGILLKVAREVSDGLAAAHAKGLIHRDIKPGNIWIEGDLASKQLGEQVRRCKILDFGLARSVDKDDAQITASGAILGTPAYMAPEQARGEKVDHRADLFSLGVMLYRMATGKVPFRGANAMAVLIALTTETPTPVRELAPNLPPKLAELIECLMSKDAAARPQSAAEVLATARRIAKDLQAKKVPVASVSDPDAPVAALPAKPAAPSPEPSASLPHVVPVAESEEDTATDDEPQPRRATKRAAARAQSDRAKRNRAPLVVAAALGALALVAVGAWFATRDPKPDPNATAQKEEPPKPKEEPKKEEPKKDAPKGDPDRAGGEYALSVGGEVTVVVGGAPREIKNLGDLPKEPFRLTRVHIANRPLTGAGSVAFEGCRNLDTLSLTGDAVSDEVLARFRDCANLKRLHLAAPKVSDAGLAHFRGCKELVALTLNCPHVRDAGAAVFADCGTLEALDLRSTQLGDAGLDQFHKIKTLTSLTITDTTVTPAGLMRFGRAFPLCRIVSSEGTLEPATVADRAAAEYVFALGGSVSVYGEREAFRAQPGKGRAKIELPTGPIRVTRAHLSNGQIPDTAGLAKLAACKNLNRLDLSGSNAGDEEVAMFAGCKNLIALVLTGTKITDAALVTLGEWKQLQLLHLSRTAVSGAGLAHLGGCTGLTELALNETNFDDTSLVSLRRHKNLTVLSLQKTKVTAARVTELSEALPECRVAWDGGTVGPSYSFDRKAAQYVFSINGRVRVNGSDKEIGDKDLPKEPFRLTGVYLKSNERVSATGLAAFKDCTEITYLGLSAARLTDDGLKHFAKCKRLKSLDVSLTGVSATGLAVFKDLTTLTDVYLHGAKITNATVEQLKASKGLLALYLNNTPVTDECAPYLKECRNLTYLNLKGTKLTPAAIDDLANALPACKIEWDKGTITPKNK